VAVVNVAEYAVLATNANGGIQIPLGTPLTTYDVAVGSSATAGPILNLTTKMVRMNTDVSCTSNNVTATDARMAANQTEYWGVPGPGFMISVITSP